MTIETNPCYFGIVRGIVREVDIEWSQSVWPGLVIRDVKLGFDDYGGTLLT